MSGFVYTFFCLVLTLSLCVVESQNTLDDKEKSRAIINRGEQFDKERLSEVNFLINSYFTNCSLDSESEVLYNCSIKTENYGEFLYALFHKEHIMNFLKLYQLQGRISTQNEIKEMYKIGEKVHEIVVSAYNQWIEIYKPNKKVRVQEMYRDIPDLDRQVLDVIEHYEEQHKDFIDVLETIYNVQKRAVKYVVMGNSTEEEIAQDYAGILTVYFGDCHPVTNCTMSIKAFVYFVKELSFYITPLIEDQNNQKTILVSEDLDFKATEFLIKEITKMKHLLGEQVDLQEIETYSEEIAMNLFQYLKSNQKTNQQNHSTKQNPTPTQKSLQIQDIQL